MPDTPLVLAFDTSAAHCAAALLSGDKVIASVREEMKRGQAEALLILCADMLASKDVSFEQLNLIGVGIGPGNFTGIRISVSAARGLALGLKIPAIGVNTFDALRFGTKGPCACAVSAPRGQVHFQAFGPKRATNPILADPSDLPKHQGPLIGAHGVAPLHPTAEAIAFCARNRMGQSNPRPSPMYLRQADAAPARDGPPPMLP